MYLLGPAGIQPVPLSRSRSLRRCSSSMSWPSFLPLAASSGWPLPSTESRGTGSPVSSVLWAALTPGTSSQAASVLPRSSLTAHRTLFSLPLQCVRPSLRAWGLFRSGRSLRPSLRRMPRASQVPGGSSRLRALLLDPGGLQDTRALAPCSVVFPCHDSVDPAI